MPVKKITSSSIAHQPLALVNARLIDPSVRDEIAGGVLIVDGLIRDHRRRRCGGQSSAPCANDRLSWRLRGARSHDMRAFIGEPGAEHRETIATATHAAAAGGVTTILARPDTSPPVDKQRLSIFSSAALAIPAACECSQRRPYGGPQRRGNRRDRLAATSGRRSVQRWRPVDPQCPGSAPGDAICARFRCSRDAPRRGSRPCRRGNDERGRICLAAWSAGTPREAEAIVLDRDIRLVNLTGARYHAALVTTALSLDIIEKAKAAGLPVTCATSINHLTLNENDIGDYRTFLKLAPPLRGEDERRDLVAGLASGLIDVIVSDHNPQDVETKRLPFAEAEDGAIGLETMLAAGLRLVHSGELPLNRLIAAMTLRPAEILRLPQGRLRIGAPADVIRFDPDEPFVVDPAALHSRCKNTPFDEARMEGRVKLTLVAGEMVYEAE